MSKSLRVSEQELRACINLVGELGELPRDAEVRTAHLLSGLCGLLGARAGSNLVSRRVRNGPKVREVCSGGTVVGLYADEHRVIADYLRDLDPPDPLAAWLYPRVEAGGAFTMRRGDIIDDAAWRRCAHYNEVRAPAGIAEPLIHSRPAGQGRVRTFCLHRGTGEAPFSPREARLLAIVIDVALHRIDAAQRDEERVVSLDAAGGPAALSPREAEVLDLLRRGLSLKECAARLRISVHTVGDYTKSLYRKFAVSSRGELLARDWSVRRESRGESTSLDNAAAHG